MVVRVVRETAAGIREAYSLLAVVFIATHPHRINSNACVLDSLATRASAGETAGASVRTSALAGKRVYTIVGASRGRQSIRGKVKNGTKKRRVANKRKGAVVHN